MAWEEPGTYKLSAKALLTLVAKQYCFITLNTSGEAIAISADTDLPVGVLQNTPAAGQQAEIMLRGVTKLKGNAAGLVAGSPVGPDSVGRGITRVWNNADNLSYVCGICLEGTGAVADEVATVYLADPFPNQLP